MPTRKSGRQRKVSKSSKSSGRVPRKTKANGYSILILECDAKKLSSQSISIAQDLNAIVNKWAPQAIRRLVQATSRQVLQSEFARCKEECNHFDIIVIIGHSNQRGLRLTSNDFVSWDILSLWIEPFQPKRIILVACEGGRWLPSKALFCGIPTLQEIYGSPIVMTQQQASVVKLLVPYLLMGEHLPDDILQMGQVAHFLITEGVLFRQTRKEFKKAGQVDAILWTGLEELIGAALRR